MCTKYVSKAALRRLLKSAPEVLTDDIPFIWDHNENDSAYAIALDSEVVGKARSLVSVCRASGQRREDLQSTIMEGNSSKSFPDGNFGMFNSCVTYVQLVINIPRACD